jgi:hypothetical protein
MYLKCTSILYVLTKMLGFACAEVFAESLCVVEGIKQLDSGPLLMDIVGVESPP